MTMKIENDKGEEIEVYTADEVQAREAAARTAVEGEYKPKLEDLTGKLTKAEQSAAQRAVEFGQFRKLSEDQVKALSEKDAIIYANQLKFQEMAEADVAAKKLAAETTRDAVIRAKVGTDQKLFDKVKDMYSLIGIEANTTQEIERKVLATLGALGQTEPDLVATISGFNVGSFEPPKQKTDQDKSFADTDAGKAAAKELGLTLEAPKK